MIMDQTEIFKEFKEVWAHLTVITIVVKMYVFQLYKVEEEEKYQIQEDQVQEASHRFQNMVGQMLMEEEVDQEQLDSKMFSVQCRNMEAVVEQEHLLAHQEVGLVQVGIILTKYPSIIPLAFQVVSDLQEDMELEQVKVQIAKTVDLEAENNIE